MKKRKKVLIGLLVVLIIGFLIPQNLKMSVQGASKSDYNLKSFWSFPWGSSVTHKNINVFEKKRD